ncbi:MAG TPA: hypothetical protein P5234_15855 [Thermoanaerobaculaceae bacterium]|nr:hypothetical protein [Thermoanaerobaculaceae bacterium]
MNAADVIGYARDGAHFCTDCASDGAPLFCGFEVDAPAHCDACGTLIEGQELTDDGREYVTREQVRALLQGREDAPALTIWADAFDLPAFPYSYSEDRIRGHYWAASDWHGGQASRGYRHLCKVSRRYTPGRMERDAGNGNAHAYYIHAAAMIARAQGGTL